MSRYTRRRALESLGGLAAASPLAQAQKLAGEPEGRIAPRAEVINLFEMEEMAKRTLPGRAYALVAGGDRAAFDRMTFRPRMMVDVQNIDLTMNLFGEKQFAPILVAPVSEQNRFHPEGEVATVRGVGAAKAITVVSSRSSQPLEKILGAAKTSVWYQAYPEADMAAVRAGIDRAVKAGCKAVVVTVDTPYRPVGADGPPTPANLKAMGNPHLDWAMIDRLRQGLTVPFLVKGVMNAQDAQTAVQHGVQGIVVSNHGSPAASGIATPVEVLPAVVDAVGGKVPVLADGGIRRGTDALKALAFGATAILIGRPVMWGLGAYGSDGVQSVLSMLQSELARTMGLCGVPKLSDIGRSVVKIHLR
jgi:4-hydroxymandelate oxidase